jgi:hypothetical protein
MIAMPKAAYAMHNVHEQLRWCQAGRAHLLHRCSWCVVDAPLTLLGASAAATGISHMCLAAEIGIGNNSM